MGVVSSKLDGGSILYLKDQNRLALTSVKITNSRNRVLYHIVPNAFPSTEYIVRKEQGDDSLLEYVQDPETAVTGSYPSLLLRLNNDDEIIFVFTFTMRQALSPSPQIHSTEDATFVTPSTIDTIINSLTFVFASGSKDLDTLVTREFNANPNLHKNPNVELVGDYTTGGSPLEQFDWTWKWRPPRPQEQRGGGWRTTCSFVEYDQRAHRLNTLAAFSFWVHNHQRQPQSPKSPSMELSVPPRLRVPSSQSVESRISGMSDSDDNMRPARDPPSPTEAIPEVELPLEPTITNSAPPLDMTYQRLGEDPSADIDGPLFRATMRTLEMKTGIMRAKIKRVIKKAEALKETQVACNVSSAVFLEALRDASVTNSNAVQPAIDHYFEKIAKEILHYEKENADNLQKLIIDPIQKLYSNEIKQADAKKKDFDNESEDYYNYARRYLGQRQDSLKEKKRIESDSKYQSRKRNFELKRFDYSSFMQDLTGGRKDQEILSQLTKYADAQARGYLHTAKRIEQMIPQLEALQLGVTEADKDFQLQRTGREEKRRAIEKSAAPLTSQDGGLMPGSAPSGSRAVSGTSDGEFSRSNGSVGGSMGERPRTATLHPSNSVTSSSSTFSGSTANQSSNFGSPGQNRFKGYRDLEDKDTSTLASSEGRLESHRKEGLLWALSRPGSHVPPTTLNKQAWHKFWIVLDQGKLSEYVNWKQNMEPHMDPIDLRIASVREARSAERRFCFEVVTPQFTRVYQATTEDDMKVWIQAINNALQSAFEDKSPKLEPTISNRSAGSIGKDIFGKSGSFHGHRSSSTTSTHSNASSRAPVSRHASDRANGNARPVVERSRSADDRPTRLLQTIREADAGNAWCADCNSESKVEWVSISLGIIVCIECSGVHRSLGTHISKVRSLTLDTTSFTPDIIELLSQIGNRVSNMIWEANYDRASGLKPGANATREQRQRFITAKYADRAYVSPLSPSTSRYSTSEEMLLASIKQNDIQNVLYSLSLKANPNATDRSRSTHAVYLALAAADPASPASTQVTPSPISTPSRPDAPLLRKPFPIAELLLQSGADLPASQPPFPLSRSATMYLEFKKEQRLGKPLPDPAFARGSANPLREASEDTLAALPSFSGSGSGPGSGSGGAGSAAQPKDKEKSYKRNSAGDRMAKLARGVGVLP